MMETRTRNLVNAAKSWKRRVVREFLLEMGVRRTKPTEKDIKVLLRTLNPSERLLFHATTNYFAGEKIEKKWLKEADEHLANVFPIRRKKT